MENKREKKKLWRSTTVVSVRTKKEVVIAADGQVTLGDSVMKDNAKKVRTLASGKVITGFAGSTADAFTLIERLEEKLEKYPGQLSKASVELAKNWRTDKYLRNLEAMMIVSDGAELLIITGSGDVLEPENHIAAVGSGGNFAKGGTNLSFEKSQSSECSARLETVPEEESIVARDVFESYSSKTKQKILESS